MTGINLLGPIGHNRPNQARRRRFDIFTQGNIIASIYGISDFSNRRSPWYDEKLIEDSGQEIFFTNAGHKTFKTGENGRKRSEVENNGSRFSEVLLQTFPSDSIYADSTNDEPKNQHDMLYLHLLHIIL